MTVIDNHGSSSRVLDELTIRKLVAAPDALSSTREALIALHRGQVQMPPAVGLSFSDNGGEAHVKSACIDGQKWWAVKVSTGFYGNEERFGLPVNDGVSLAFSVENGSLECVLLDHGYLTDLRTAAAGALAAHLLARRELDRVLMVGAGRQARFQLRAMLGVRRPQAISLFARRPAQAEQLQAELRKERIEVVIETDLPSAASRADLIITATPAREPLLRRDWIRPGTHITAVGADAPGKRELEAELVERADLLASDLPPADLRVGELSAARALGLAERLTTAALGAIAAGDVPGRSDPDQITIADLVGTGAADTAIANAALEGLAATVLPGRA